jgi:branched-chain amino acid transport system ATP-binding protein
MLLLDEPISGMNTEETKHMMDLIMRICKEGTTILLVEHDMKFVLSMCERIAVLNFGRKIAEGSPEKIVNDQEVIEQYLGPGEKGTYVA